VEGGEIFAREWGQMGAKKNRRAEGGGRKDFFDREWGE